MNPAMKRRQFLLGLLTVSVTVIVSKYYPQHKTAPEAWLRSNRYDVEPHPAPIFPVASTIMRPASFTGYWLPPAHIIFDNDPTVETLQRAETEDALIIVHHRGTVERFELTAACLRDRLGASERIVMWWTGLSQGAFEFYVSGLMKPGSLWLDPEGLTIGKLT
jgi:hypothetical protein